MDYGGGTEVVRYTWGEVHDPVGNFTLFDGDGEGESVAQGSYYEFYMTSYDEQQSRLSLTIHHHNRVAVLDFTKEKINFSELSSRISNIQNNVKIFNGTTQEFQKVLIFNPKTGEPIPQRYFKIIVNGRHSRQYYYQRDWRKVKPNEGICILVDDLGRANEATFGIGDIAGQAYPITFGRIMAIEENAFFKVEGHTIPHEEGHRLDLDHDHDNNNVMSYNHPFSKKVTTKQKNIIGQTLWGASVPYMFENSIIPEQKTKVLQTYANSVSSDLNKVISEIQSQGGSKIKLNEQ
jgi:hypothetical protein